MTIGDANAGATDMLTITVGGAGGTLSGTGLSRRIRRRLHAVRNGGRDHQRTRRPRLHAEGGRAEHDLDDDVHAERPEQRLRRAGRRQRRPRVIDSDPAVAPTISGTVSGQTTTSEAPVKPFAHVTIGDANADATDMLTITLGGAGGTLADGTGLSGLDVGARVYTLSGTAAAITSELDALVFTPKAGAPNTTSTTTFTLSDQSSAGGAPSSTARPA